MEYFADDIRLSGGGPLSLRFYNPMFNDIGSYSYPLSFSAKDINNQKAFGFPSHRGNSNSPLVEGLISDPHFSMPGTWKVVQADKDIIEATFLPADSTFYSRFKNVTLKDLEYNGGIDLDDYLEFGTIQEKALVLADAVVNKIYPEVDFTIYPVYMPNAWGSATAEEDKFINPFTIDGYTELEFTRIDSFYMFVGAIIYYIFKEAGYLIKDNVFQTDPELRRLTIFNTTQRVFNAFLYYHEFVPGIGVLEFIKALRNRFNIGFFINEDDKTVSILRFTDIVKKPPVELSGAYYQGRIDKNRTGGFSFAADAPDDWSSSEFDSVDDFSELIAQEANKLRDIDAIINNKNYWYHVLCEASIYRVELVEAAYQAVRKCPYIFPYLAGDGETVIDQYSGIPSMYTHTVEMTYFYMEGEIEVQGTTDVDIVLPRCDLEGISSADKQLDFPLMFLLSRESQLAYVVPATEAPEVAYPLANNDIYDASGNEITGATLSLRWDSDSGIIENFWSSFIDWAMNRKEVEIIDEVLELDLKILSDFSTPVRINNNNYLVNSFILAREGNKTMIRELELFRL